MNQLRLLFLIVAIFLAEISPISYAQLNTRDPGSVQNRMTVVRADNDLGSDMSLQAHSLSCSGHYKEAEQQFKAALAYWDEHPSHEPHDLPNCLNNFGLLYANQGKYDQAVPVYEKALACEAKSLTADDPLVALTSDNMAQAYRLQGKLQEAEPHYLKALAVEEKSMAPDDQDHAITMFNLSLLYFQMGKYDKCEPLMTQSLAVLKKSLGENNPDYLNCYKYYLTLLRKTNRSQQADMLEVQMHLKQNE